MDTLRQAKAKVREFRRGVLVAWLDLQLSRVVLLRLEVSYRLAWALTWPGFACRWAWLTVRLHWLRLRHWLGE